MARILFRLVLIILTCSVHRAIAECQRPDVTDYTVTITPSEWTYNTGSEVIFSCSGGGDVYGPTSSVCQSNGEWDYESEPLCAYCERPSFSNPYAILIAPDREIYSNLEQVLVSCREGHTLDNLQSNPTCRYNQFELRYELLPDPSSALCLAQCDTTELLESDVIAKNPNFGSVQTIFLHGESAIFSCQDASRFTGQNSATCNNGSFSFDTPPACLDPCHIILEDIEARHLSYISTENPVINETHTLYYGDGSLIVFSCDYYGYSPRHCTGLCIDGAWEPEFPSCIPPGPPGLPAGAIVGISCLTVLLVASFIVNIIFWRRARSEQDADMDASSYRVTTNGNIQLVTGNHNNPTDRPYTSLQFGPAKANVTKGDRKRVTFLTKLGSLGMGDFGETWKGEFRTTQEQVLIRRVPDDKPKSKDLLGRVKVFSQLPDHPNIVKCLGYLPDQNIILYKFIPGGTLLTHLQMKRGQTQPRYSAYNHVKPQEAPVDEVGLINFALQIAKGLQFLTSEKITHGSLCAHNVLLDDNKICKVSDYGMALSMLDQRVRPSRWNSPETMLDGVYSAEADVWSFGIVIWEIMSLGGRPYPDLDLDEIGHEITNGYKMPRPPHSANELYTIMSRCWEKNSRNRPKINEIIIDLEKILTKTQESLNYLLLNELDNDTYHAYASVD